MSRGSLFRPRLVFSGRRRADEAPAPGGADRAERFRRIMLPHMDAAYTLARYLTRNPTVAEDVVQDAFLRAYRSFDGWRGEAPKAWLLAIVRNCFLSSLASERARAWPVGDPDVIVPTSCTEAIDERDPEAILVEQSDAAMLRNTIEKMPEPFREALVLRELEDLPYKEIASITRVPIGTVMSRLARARQMLAALLLPDQGSTTEARS
jgi:RNA polymerase sigma factor (sigma-70 family)